ncbi:unnamed protein product [Rhizophagus irregularis]|nr:unnamed protein product [Rhizophagus irregularis]
MDSKHDLNNDRAPILVFVIENNSGSGTPLAFGLSNRENQWTIKLSISAIKKNIPCNQDVMIDKHRPSKIAITNVLHGSILCWFHIMQTIGENFNQLNIPWSLRYPLALAFKVIGRSRTEEESKELAGLATLFDMKSIEEQNCPKKLSSDKLRRLNHGRLYFLLGLVEPSNNANYFYIRKSDNSQILESPFNGKFVELDIRLYHLQGGSIFLPKNNTSERNSDPFRPSELNKHNVSNKGAPPKAVAKPRKPSRILQAKNQTNSHNETLFASSEKRSTKRIRKTIRTAKEKVQTKEEIIL